MNESTNISINININRCKCRYKHYLNVASVLTEATGDGSRRNTKPNLGATDSPNGTTNMSAKENTKVGGEGAGIAS